MKNKKRGKNKKNSFRGGAEYKALALFVLGTVGFLLFVYVGFGLVVTAIKADRLMHNYKIDKRVPSEAGTIRHDIRRDTEIDTNKKIDVIVKEVFGKIISVNGDTVTIETKIYGKETKNVRLRFVEQEGGGIFKYETIDQGEGTEVEMEIKELEEGMYAGVRLPVELLLSEIEKDIIYVDNMVLDVEYKESESE